MTAFAILLAMAVGVGLMLTRRLPTAFALVLLSVAIALIAGAPLVGEEGSVTGTVVQQGAPRLAATMIAILLGSWLGTLMSEAGIASTLVRKIVEFGGERPSLVAVGVFVVAILCGSITGSAPAAMLAGVVGIPAMIAVGVTPTVAAGTVLVGIAAGLPLELINWQFLSDAIGVPVSTVQHFQLRLFPIALAGGLAYILIEMRRRGARHTWAVRVPAGAGGSGSGGAGTRPPSRRQRAAERRRRRGDAPWYALVTPLVPIVLALGLHVPIVPSLLAGVVFALLTAVPWREMSSTALRTLYRAFDVAAPPIVLFIAIGMLLAAVNLPGAVSALTPVVTAISPSSPWLFVLVFAVLVPLALYRGPMNIFGLGAGVAGVLISGGIYPAPAVLGLMASYGQVLGVSDPTSTQTVWSAQYAGVRPERSMLSTLPYTWVIAVAGLVLTVFLYLV
ncbi:transporter [Nocardiopsis dassonvillei]|uniref:Citrate transporter n=1 Tax=Nocardiopsis dassonvillei (strain ATCC 23218 / DSM 43111 / CIP 107115 / JCM 7437 / KCTC 9190 / NBRC 14626 / NCTC 10488 / NRRL B-5397 / IMRU 509) TaxID=446468 RepID=D7AXM6_NOCDD|nr:transporter [Nocardiopsis dassonvillei]ADH67930.1 Citrate transporter [Nocardiopsis dassonvillei subsp. dassonvillei DSM 43111]NKY79315.1 transporter [Nocardiopsis dassonvillei]VEI88432.1 Citrate transporter [Nocardiopsis dassonvillei]